MKLYSRNGRYFTADRDQTGRRVISEHSTLQAAIAAAGIPDEPELKPIAPPDEDSSTDDLLDLLII